MPLGPGQVVDCVAVQVVDGKTILVPGSVFRLRYYA
jgi:hypothetical protein